MHIEIIPYNREIDIKYLKKIMEKLIKKIDEIKKEYKTQVIVFSCQGFCFDGLAETNDLLIKHSCKYIGYCEIYNTCTGEMVKFSE